VEAYPPSLVDTAIGDCIFDGCLRDETVEPSIAVFIDSLIGGEFSLTEVGFWCIAVLMNKRYKRTPHINTTVYPAPHQKIDKFILKQLGEFHLHPPKVYSKGFHLSDSKVYHFLRESIFLSGGDKARFAPRKTHATA
jgi:hypothetical protein